MNTASIQYQYECFVSDLEVLPIVDEMASETCEDVSNMTEIRSEFSDVYRTGF